MNLNDFNTHSLKVRRFERITESKFGKKINFDTLTIPTAIKLTKKLEEESLDLEKAQIMFKLTRKNNWGACYDRLEHFKRFTNLKLIIKELSQKQWIIVHNKPKFTGISLNTKYKKEIRIFIEEQIPYLKGVIK